MSSDVGILISCHIRDEHLVFTYPGSCEIPWIHRLSPQSSLAAHLCQTECDYECLGSIKKTCGLIEEGYLLTTWAVDWRVIGMFEIGLISCYVHCICGRSIYRNVESVECWIFWQFARFVIIGTFMKRNGWQGWKILRKYVLCCQ